MKSLAGTHDAIHDAGLIAGCHRVATHSSTAVAEGQLPILVSQFKAHVQIALVGRSVVVLGCLRRSHFQAPFDENRPFVVRFLDLHSIYSLNRWVALTRFLDDGDLPIDNNWVENRVRPIALGRQNWLFAGSLRAGKRAAAVMSLIHSAKLNGLDPYAYMRDVLERLPTQPASRIAELLTHHWQPAASA